MNMHDALKNPAAEAGRNRLLAVGGLAALLLVAGCGALPDKPARSTLYDFGPGPVTAASAPAAAPSLPPIALADFDATSRLDGSQMLYRLGYADANEVRPYGQSRWSQPPAQLLRQRVREALAVDRTVLGPEESAAIARTQGRVPDMLRVSLEEFSHFFESPDKSFGLVRVNATLIRNNAGGDRVLAQRSFTGQRPAPSNDASGGVKALAAASDAVVADLVAWVGQAR
jgi:cholesterol transport system auxiliary component